MNFYLIPGDNEHPLTHVALSADGSRCLAGTSAGTLLAYGLDGNPPEELPLPQKYVKIAGLAFSGASHDALAIGMTSQHAGDVLRVLDVARTEILYGDAPYEFAGAALAPDGSFGLLAGGGQLLRWYPEQRSYLPVETPEGWLLSSIALSADGSGLVAGGCATGGFVARYAPRPGTGRLEPLAAAGLPALGAVAWDGARGLAGGQPGGLAYLEPSHPLKVLPGPKNAIVHAIAFHPTEGWALLACGQAGATDKGAELYRLDPGTGKLTVLYEGPPGAGAFLAAAWIPGAGKAIIATEWGQLLEMAD